MNCGIDNSGNAVSQPLKNLSSLLGWSPPDFNICASGNQQGQYNDQQALRHTRQVSNRPKVLVCHDMAGGYLNDRFIQGCSGQADDAYLFQHWQLIDTFIYFSHSFVTIPPTGWIRAAHRHGVDILGTIITEWEDGAALCKEMLASYAQVDEITTKLAHIASYFGFDGWLINIENVIEPDQVPLLQSFARQLTQKCHMQLQFSTVLWYDSVINTGELKWQDEVNSKNEMFFDVCDGIFLNYCITPEKLRNSKEKAGFSARQGDVYVGLDCFGRGTPGGGGFNLRVVLEMVLSEGLSVAFFAPGWVMEHLGPENFQDNNIKFWGLLSDLLNTRPTSLPFSTSFCQGKGDRFYLHGKVIADKPWYNLGLQQVQPSFTQSQFSSYHMNHNKSSVINIETRETKEPKVSLAKDNTDGEIINEFPSGNSITEKILEQDNKVDFGNETQFLKSQDMTDHADGAIFTYKPEKEVKVAAVDESKQADVKPILSYDTSCGYIGGGCMRIEASSTSYQPVIFKLMEISKTEDLKQLRVIWKTKQDYDHHQFVLMLSPADKEASLKNAEMVFESNISKAAASLLYTHAPTSVCCIPLEQPHEVIKHGNWVRSVHIARPEDFNFCGATQTSEMTLSVVLMPCEPQNTEPVCTNFSIPWSTCIWLGQIQAFTEKPSDLISEPLLFPNIRCLAVKTRQELSCTDLEQMAKHPCFKTDSRLNSNLSNTDCHHTNSSAGEVANLTFTNSRQATTSSFPAQRFPVETAHNLSKISSAFFTKLDLTNTAIETNDSCVMHYLLKWDVPSRNRIDYFIVYLGMDIKSCTLVGFATSNHFIYSTKHEINNMCFFIQPVLLFEHNNI